MMRPGPQTGGRPLWSRPVLWSLILYGLPLIGFTMAMLFGRYGAPVGDVFQLISGKLTGYPAQWSATLRAPLGVRPDPNDGGPG